MASLVGYGMGMASSSSSWVSELVGVGLNGKLGGRGRELRGMVDGGWGGWWTMGCG